MMESGAPSMRSTPLLKRLNSWLSCLATVHFQITNQTILTSNSRLLTGLDVNQMYIWQWWKNLQSILPMTPMLICITILFRKGAVTLVQAATSCFPCQLTIISTIPACINSHPIMTINDSLVSTNYDMVERKNTIMNSSEHQTCTDHYQMKKGG